MDGDTPSLRVVRDAMEKPGTTQLAVRVENESADYVTLEDDDAAKRDLLRIVDESSEVIPIQRRSSL